MKAKDIMTTPVISVTPDTTVSEIAALLFERRISAVPVLEDGRLVGIVSEADLLHRHELGTDCIAQSGSWWLRLFSADRSIEEYIKSHARRARDIMTREVATVAPETSVAEVATVLERRAVKRVPVVEAGRLAGIVSRANLVQALARTPQAATRATRPSDEAIRALLLAELERQPWWRRGMSSVYVSEGVVTFSGAIGAEEERHAARVAAENLAGVRRIEDRRQMYRDMPSMV
ncbi:MAG TPA: CBS domain-containing protein [Burkholderiales bacterium]|nr:CBS domain-containing protein [Burkholderiales bacterium]